MYVIFVYDISMDSKGKKVWRKVFQISKIYLHHIQNSVFEGELSKAQIYEFNKKIKKEIRIDKDSVILFKSRNKRWLEKEFLGIDDDLTSRFI